MDIGSFETDMYIARLERRIRSVYKEAEKDIEDKTNDFLRRYKVKESKYAQQVKDGKITQEQFDKWKKGQVFQGKQWNDKREQIAQTLYDANKIAAKMANDQKGSVFVSNANYMAYYIEHGVGVNFGFNLYDSATVAHLIKRNPQVLPYYTPKKSKDMSWNMSNITRQVTLGIIEGESLDKIAKRMAKATGSANMNSMLTNARTGMTMAQNSGRIERMKEAKDLGIKLHKEWMATLDPHTRWQHATLDGQKKKLEEPFEVGAYSIMYPGDPMAHPSMVFNCRCTLVSDIDDYPSEYKRYDNIEGKPIKNMTYREWEKAKGTRYSYEPTEKLAKKFNQVSIGAAKSVDEINKLLNMQGLFKNGVADLTGCDLDSAKSVAAAYEQIFSKYPTLRGKFTAPDAHPVGMGKNTYAWCYYRNGHVQVNPNQYNNWAKISKSYERDVVTGWHPYGTTAESIITHEIGHAVDGLLAREGISGGRTKSGEYRMASSSLKTMIMNRAAKKDQDLADLMAMDKTWKGKQAVSQYVSEYATKNNKEWFAECFAEYITSANPRIVASEFGKELEVLLGRLK